MDWYPHERDPKNLSCPHTTMWGIRSQLSAIWKRDLIRTTLTMNFQPPELWERNSYCLGITSLSYFAMAAWDDQNTEIISVHSFSSCCWWATFPYSPILLTQRRKGQINASWRSSHSWGPDPWQGLKTDVGLPDQLCVLCDPVFEPCLLCYGAIPPDTAVTLQSLSFLFPSKGTPLLLLGHHSRPLGNLWALPFQPSHSVLGLGLLTIPWDHV